MPIPSARRSNSGTLCTTTPFTADRPDIAEEATAGGPLASKQVPLPDHCDSVPLQPIHRFDEIIVNPADETAETPNQSSRRQVDPPVESSWLTRRITRNALEVWTPVHGWLFDGGGRLLNKARSPGDERMGRQWFGAFLPDGRWVTTDVAKTGPEPLDFYLTFFSREGKWLKDIPSARLATEVVPGVKPDPALAGARCWAGRGATRTARPGWSTSAARKVLPTVQIGPEGPPHQFMGVGRWRACYPRALGARGDYIDMWVPDDSGKILLERSSAGHGYYVGYPAYVLIPPLPIAMPDGLTAGKGVGDVPNGNDIFGFWPGRRDVFIGSIRTVTNEHGSPVRSWGGDEENATWFFNSAGHFQGLAAWTPSGRCGGRPRDAFPDGGQPSGGHAAAGSASGQCPAFRMAGREHRRRLEPVR